MSGDIHSFPCIKERMAKMTIALWTILWIVIAFLIYKFIINPQIVVPSVLKETCPTRWTFKDGMCHPDYETNCVPFDPSKLTSFHEKCDIAKKCGTDWSGMCL